MRGPENIESASTTAGRYLTASSPTQDVPCFRLKAIRQTKFRFPIPHC